MIPSNFEPATLEHTTRRIFAHPKTQCAGQPRCSLHNRSEHNMRGFPQHWRKDRYLMERICPHGVGHPDPDHLWWIECRLGFPAMRLESIHGCDGCCSVTTPKEEQ